MLSAIKEMYKVLEIFIVFFAVFFLLRDIALKVIKMSNKNENFFMDDGNDLSKIPTCCEFNLKPNYVLQLFCNALDFTPVIEYLLKWRGLPKYLIPKSKLSLTI